MIKTLKIVGFMTLLLAFVACEKCDKPTSTEDAFINASERGAEKEGYQSGNRSDGVTVISGGHGDGGITDPNGDEDYDGIVDPEGDEDYDKEGK